MLSHIVLLRSLKELQLLLGTYSISFCIFCGLSCSKQSFISSIAVIVMADPQVLQLDQVQDQAAELSVSIMKVRSFSVKLSNDRS